MKLRELKDKSIEELQKTYKDLCVKRQEMNFKVASKQLKNIREMRKLKTNIAQILTLLKIREEK
ncbi:MAG: 50S ribosomal protein L29P [Parcubacteria group bacterium GW2011_GWC2_38_7]|nr:MAG: 50S ribosomal protein L29P [Parcubacteria group bacterium GW2011_GWC2_38_7]